MAIPDYFYFILGVCLLVSFCVVVFYAKRHPNPHFRPKKSDIGLVSFLLLFVSGGVAFMTASAFDVDFDKEKMDKKMKDAKRAADMKGTSVESELGVDPGKGRGGDGSADGGEGDVPGLPSEVPKEFREIIGGGK